MISFPSGILQMVESLFTKEENGQRVLLTITSKNRKYKYNKKLNQEKLVPSYRSRNELFCF
jgi:hypothetical protein